MASVISADDRIERGHGVWLDFAALGCSGITLRLALSAAMRHEGISGSPSPAISWVVGLLGAGSLVAAFFRIRRRADAWIFNLGASVILILTFSVGRYRPEIAPLELPLAILCLTPAGVLIWEFVRGAMRADEFQRRILVEALGVAAVIQTGGAVIYAFLEGLSLPRLSALLWAGLFIVGWTVGLAAVARRYRS